MDRMLSPATTFYFGVRSDGQAIVRVQLNGSEKIEWLNAVVEMCLACPQNRRHLNGRPINLLRYEVLAAVSPLLQSHYEKDDQ